MQYRDLKNKAKKLGLRVTKTVKGKRVKLSAKELRSKITMNFENSVKNAQKVIRVCQNIVAPTVVRAGAPPPPPPPPQYRKGQHFTVHNRIGSKSTKNETKKSTKIVRK